VEINKNMSPIYAELLQKLRILCNKNGYGCCVHGSLAKDLDIVAVPFGRYAITNDELLLEVIRVIGKTYKKEEIKVHYRKAYWFELDEFHFLDFSILPINLEDRKDKETDNKAL
jgi:hypothetical protein